MIMSIPYRFPRKRLQPVPVLSHAVIGEELLHFPELFSEDAYGRPRERVLTDLNDLCASWQPIKKKTKPSDQAAEPPMFLRDNTFLKCFKACSLASISQTSEALLFNRKELQRVMTLLARSNIECTQLQGPPGCGKSSAMWAITCILAKRHPDLVIVWVNTTQGRRIIMHQGMVVPEAVDSSTDFRKVTWNEQQLTPRVVVFDGLEPGQEWDRGWGDAVRAIRKQQQQSEPVRVHNLFLVTSMQMELPFMRRISKITMEAWSLDDFTVAVAFDDFWETVRDNLGAVSGRQLTHDERAIVVRRKYSIAGASARWMYDTTVQDVFDDIDQHLSRVSDFDKLLSGIMHSVDARSREAINHLTYSVGGVSLLISDVVVRRVAEKCGKSALVAITHTAKRLNNPILDGIVLEMDVLHAIRADLVGNQFRMVINHAVAPDYDNSFAKVGAVIDFHKDVPDCPAAGKPYTAGQCFFPEVSNQGGFVCAVLMESTENEGALKVRFLQVTRPFHHKIKMQFMRVFVHALNKFIGARPPVMEYEVLIVVPMDRALAFQLPDANDTTKIEGTAKQEEGDGEVYDYRVVGFNRAPDC